ncbi:putative ABC transporter extracellular-binding protein YurO [Brevibacillus reuszeri]|uniref:ABC transporter substrate-binding protein n=1 Tax=Brevibacillus reuszeri TaxID=54915 RepID=UPI001AFF984B|nr:extracellular solute-binding protein [Brevibacillus reuszeri]GIO05840.1 putative ABC transporter extracellular-binding protein YurO [Brevibacillus reuszeri]
MHRTNVVRFMLWVAMLALFIAGCQSPAGSGGSASSEPVKEKPAASENKQGDVLKLLIPSFNNETEKRQWDKVVKKFEEMNPGVKIDLATGDTNTESGKLTTMLQSGVTPPDAILMNAGPGRVRILSDVDLIKPLNDWYTQNGWKDKLRPFAYDLISGNDNLYELPHTMDAVSVYYNKDLFEQNGIGVPTTAEEFVNAMKKLHDKQITPIIVGGRTPITVGTLFSLILQSSAGKDAVADLIYSEAKWNDPKYVKAAETMADWANQGYIGKESVSLNLTDAKFAMLNKKAGMFISTTHIISDVVDQKLEGSVGSFTIPSLIDTSKTNPTGGLGYTWVVPAKTTQTELVEKWMNYIVSEDYAKVVLGDPTYNLILASKAAMSIKPAGSLLAEAMSSIEKESGYNPSVFIGSEAKQAYYQNLTGLIGGLVKPKDAMDNIAAAAEKDVAAGYKLSRKSN